MSRGRINEIEHLIATGELSAAQVFTQMKQLIEPARSQGDAEQVGLITCEDPDFYLGEGRYVLRAEFKEWLSSGTKLYTQPPSGVPESITSEIQSILDDYSHHCWPVGRGGECLECHEWNPRRNEPESHGHRDDCEAFKEFKRRTDWVERLKALLHTQPPTGMPEGWRVVRSPFLQKAIGTGPVVCIAGPKNETLTLISDSEDQRERAAYQFFDALLSTNATPPRPEIELLGDKHNGMRISAEGVLGRVKGMLKPMSQEMLKQLEAMAEAFYSGNVKAVDQFLQTWDLDDKRPNPPEQGGE